MKKISASLFILISWLAASAQEIPYTHPCAAHKQKLVGKNYKATRTTVNDVALMAKYDVHNYALLIAAENNTLTIAGATTIGAIANSTIDTFAFELSTAHTIDSITYNGALLPKWTGTDMGYAKLNSTIPAGSNFAITVHYHGTCVNTGASAIGYGFNTDTSPSWGNSVTWTLSQPYSAYQWFACKQALQDKADSSSVSIITSKTNKAGSNGKLISIDTLANNKVRYNWKSNYPIDYYLISIAVAQYVDYSFYAHPTSLPNDSIYIQNYVYNNPATLPNFKTRIDTIAQMIEYFSDKVSLYPFAKEKYGTCMAPLSGGMEHQTMTTEGFHEFTLNAHELFHQWFGDNVTCKTWSDIFVNEAFASYGEYLALEKLRSLASAQADMAAVHNRVMASAGGSIYFTDTTNARIFDSRLTYDKGSAVVHSLRFVLGDSAFFKTLTNFQNTYANGTASITDFKTIAETTSGKNLTDFFDQWVYKQGFINFNAQYASDGKQIIIVVNHTGSVSSNNLYKTPLEIRCKSASGDTTILVNITQNAHTFTIPSTKSINGLVIDPNNWLLNTSVVSANPNLFVGIASLDAQQSLQVYPNPSHDYFTIAGAELCNAYTITNITGDVIAQGNIVPNTIYCKQWPKGVYTLNLSTKQGQQLYKKLLVD
jgi:aminopeptidase N